MSWNYWDYNSTSSTTGSYYNPSRIWPRATTSATNSTWASPYTATNAGTNYWYYVTIVEKFLVESPDHWGEPEIAGFVRLINDETKTGFKVEMVLSGDIKITDPTIQVRSMKNFIPLLKSRANSTDRVLIEEFFRQVPVDKPSDDTGNEER